MSFRRGVVAAAGLVVPASVAVRVPGEVVPGHERVERPRIVAAVRPVYPDEVRLAGIRGRVELEVMVGADGALQGVVELLESPSPLLAAAAVDALDRFRFEPGCRGGAPERMALIVPFTFRDRAAGLQEADVVPAVTLAGALPGTEGQPIRMSADLTPPEILEQVEPRYPEEAEASGVDGIVIVEVIVNREGQVEEPRVLRGHPLLDEAAIDAIRGWRLRPARLDGRPVAVYFTVTVNFTSAKPERIRNPERVVPGWLWRRPPG